MESFPLDWHAALAVTAGALSLAASFIYIWGILREGSTRPNAVSFFLWTVLEGIAVVAQIKAGASWSIVIPLVFVVDTGIITVLAFIGYGYRKYGATEVVCLLLGAVALVAWQITGDPVLAIVLAVGADVCATIPTLLKAYRDPASEQALSWLLVTLGGACALFATTRHDTANLAYPVYVCVMDGAIFLCAAWTRSPQIKQ